MVKNSEAALQFLQTAFEAIELQADEEKAEVAEILKSKGHGKLNPWDLSFGLILLKKERLQGFDVKTTRQYFPVHRVFLALQEIAENLFSLRFEPSAGTDAWHPSVTSCLVYDKAGSSESLIGRLFFDIYTREGKMDGACCTTVRPPIPEVQLAEVILNANMPVQENACLSYLEAKTILHELGHCVHALLAKQRYARFAGISCEMDFVEAPSQMLELWLTNKDLFNFAINEEGQRIPDRLLDQLISSQEIGRGISERSSIFLSKLAVSLSFALIGV
jgi:thimet oligopeptidase